MIAAILRLVFVCWLCRKAWLRGKGLPIKGHWGFWAAFGLSSLVSAGLMTVATLGAPRVTDRLLMEAFLIGLVAMFTLVALTCPVAWGIGRWGRGRRNVSQG